MSDIREILGVDEATLLRMAGTGPRYISYPTASEWKGRFPIEVAGFHRTVNGRIDVCRRNDAAAG